ncbi:tetratricopeptide repeat-containing sensor histidine kinase [Winogradskyella undariae]|uniref:tetratricopeptide repeat-containing sensor histidine kinase n=1 Tax=Winogradskyella undariae TaxID=1285465 RepID=UPI001C2CAC8C|nr:tetratricopeptide repeat-containing sensor histidine kinase [Winogradskyella undariae]
MKLNNQTLTTLLLFCVNLLFCPSIKVFKNKTAQFVLRYFKIKLLSTLAICLLSLSVFSQNEKIDKLTVQLTYLKADSTKVDLSLMLINELYKNENYSKALLYINNSSKLAEDLNYKKGLAESCYYRALIFTQRDDYLNAIDNYKKSRVLYLQIKDTIGVAKVSNSIGLIEIKRGNYYVGLQNSLSAIDIFKAQSLNEELSLAYNNLAEAYYKTNQIDKSIEFNFKGLEIKKHIKDIEGIKISTKNIAELYSLLKEHRKAIEYYEKVLALLDPETDKDLKGEILPKLGSEYLRFNEYDKASQYLEEGLKHNREQNNKEGILRTLNAMGNLSLQNKNLKQAQYQLDEAYIIAQETNNKTELLKNYKLHIALDSTREYFQTAFFWQNKFHNLKDSLNKKVSPVIPTEIEHLNLIEDDIKIEITEQSSAPVLEAGWHNKPSILYSTTAIIIFLLSLLIYSLLKTKAHKIKLKKQEDKLIEEHEKTEAILEQIHHLEEVNKVKDKLFSIVSHDLKDSISSIKAFLDLLKEDNISKEEFNELIPELSENANNASTLLFNLLNWSKSQLQNLEPKPELFNIQEVFHNKMALVEQKIEDKRIILIDESQRDFIYADKSMIEIVIQNLITNAVKFCRVGDIITISNKNVNGKSLIVIEDSGIGISKNNIDKLFASNKNFTTKGTQNEKGTGLGLTIAKDLVELNNGKIWVDSTENIGSKFFVELPKAESLA